MYLPDDRPRAEQARVARRVLKIDAAERQPGQAEHLFSIAARTASILLPSRSFNGQCITWRTPHCALRRLKALTY